MAKRILAVLLLAAICSAVLSSQNLTGRTGWFSSPTPIPVGTCGGSFSSANGMFASPGYPIRNYPNLAVCRYEIRAKHGRRIVVIFDDFQLEQRYDTLMIEQVISGSTASRQVLTGSGHVGKRFFSMVNVLKFEFRSDESVAKRGFLARYHTILSVCGGSFTSLNGSFSSPFNSDGKYPNGANCRYEIRVPKDRRIVLTFDDFELEQGYDKLGIKQLSSRSLVHVTELTGSKVAGRSFTSAENLFVLQFTSDRSVTARGFVARYHTIKSGSKKGALADMDTD